MLENLRSSVRLARAAAVLASHHVLWPAELGPAPRGLHLAGRLARQFGGRPSGPKSDVTADRLATALERLGPPYIKFGQLLAMRPDMIGAPLASELQKLQDKLPPFSDMEARRTIEEELGGPLDSLFDELSPPIAAASVAQVHKARTARAAHNRAGGAGATVAVKILRPGIEKAFARDLESFRFAARLIEGWSSKAQRLRPVALVETLASSVAQELDLRIEAAAASELAENTRGDADFRVPRVDWTLTNRRVLTLEWIEGTPIADRAALAAKGHDLRRLAAIALQSFLTQALRDGFFHADMHQGNLFVDDQGRLTVVDFGIMGRLDPPVRRYLAEILLGFLTRDYKRVADIHFEAGYVAAHHSPQAFAQALRAIGEPILGRNAGELSMARLLAQLFETTAIFNMQLRPELVLLQKTMVVVEGLARALDPEQNLWETARPVIERWLSGALSPETRLQNAAESAASLGRILAHLPDTLRRVEGAAASYAEHGIKLDPETIKAIGRAQAKGDRTGRLALIVAALALVLAALALL